MAKFDVDVQGVTYEVDAPDENTAWKWAVATHKTESQKIEPVVPKTGTSADLIPTGGHTVPAAQQKQPSFISKLARQGGLTARHGIEGLVGVGDFFASPIRAGLNVVLPDDKQIKPAGPTLANAIGLPKPKDATERVVGDITRTMAGGASFSKGAELASKGIQGVTKAIMEQLAAKPGSQILASAGSGAGGGIARESGAGPVGQIVASLAGGIGALGIPAAGSALTTGGKRVINIADQFLPGGATRSAGRVGAATAGENIDDVVSALSNAHRTETARQAAVPSQNREFSGLMKMAEQNAPTKTGVKLDAQVARRSNVLGDVKPDLAISEAAKKTASDINYQKAFAEKFNADPELARMASNPYFKKAMGEVADLAQAKGVTFHENPTQFLHYVKIGLDKMMKRSGDTALAGTEKEAVTGLQKQLVDWIGRKNPKYEFARSENQRLSRPIEQSKVIDAIEQTMKGVGGKERVAPTVNALGRGEESLVKSATGFRKDELSSVLTPRQMKVVGAIENQFERDVLANRFAQEGSSKANTIFRSEEVPLTIPNLLSRPVMLANSVLKRAEGYGSKRTLDELSRLNLNPREFAEVLKNAKPAVRDMISKEILLQKSAIGQVGQQQGER